MIIFSKSQSIHKAYLMRLLTELIDDELFSISTYFKGGTCASMLGWLDRFSADLDFDLKGDADELKVDRRIRKILEKLKMSLKHKAKGTLYYELKYIGNQDERNTLKLSVIRNTVKSNLYKAFYFPDIDRYAVCQTLDSSFANKLVSISDRYNKYGKIAGRDIYDIHHYFISGYDYRSEIIKERTGKDVPDYLSGLIDFINKHINDTLLAEDLGNLLSKGKFASVRKTLKNEVIYFLNEEIKKIKQE